MLCERWDSRRSSERRCLPYRAQREESMHRTQELAATSRYHGANKYSVCRLTAACALREHGDRPSYPASFSAFCCPAVSMMVHQALAKRDRHTPQQENVLAGCSKSLSSKAAGEWKPETYPQGYVEDFNEPRTKLASFFSIRLDIWDLPVDRSQPRIGKVSIDMRKAPASEKLSC